MPVNAWGRGMLTVLPSIGMIRWGRKREERRGKLKVQYFGYLMRRVDSLEKILMLGGMGAGGEGEDRG